MRGKNAGKFRRTRDWPAPQANVASVGAEPRKKSGPGQQTAKVPCDKDGWVLVAPQTIVSELSLYGFGDDVKKPYMLELVHRGEPCSHTGTYAVGQL